MLACHAEKTTLISFQSAYVDSAFHNSGKNDDCTSMSGKGVAALSGLKSKKIWRLCFSGRKQNFRCKTENVSCNFIQHVGKKMRSSILQSELQEDYSSRRSQGEQ